MSDIIWAVLYTLPVAALIIGIYLFLDKWHWPRTIRAEIIASLEATEKIGVSDISSNVSGVANRWRLLKVGIQESGRYGLEEYIPRMESALKVMEPVEGALVQQSRLEGTNVRLLIGGY